MNDDQRNLLEAIRQFKRADQTDLEAALNLVISHAATIKDYQERIAALESTLDWISLAAQYRRVPREC